MLAPLTDRWQSGVLGKNNRQLFWQTEKAQILRRLSIRAKFITKEYSNYKDIASRYKNVSNKIITAIRFKWYGENAFNEPVDMGALNEGWGSGFTDDALRPGVSDYSQWSVLSRDGKKVLIAYPYEVAFKDGTKWELSQ